jgi:hypothetical protein
VFLFQCTKKSNGGLQLCKIGFSTPMLVPRGQLAKNTLQQYQQEDTK